MFFQCNLVSQECKLTLLFAYLNMSAHIDKNITILLGVQVQKGIPVSNVAISLKGFPQRIPMRQGRNVMKPLPQYKM